MKKALMYASVASMIQQFNMDNIRLLQGLGYEVDVACNMIHGSSISDEKIQAMKKELEETGVKTYHIPVPRKITALGEIFASLKLTKKLINERKYDIIHCHSPIGGMICRISNRISRNYKNSKLIYTAHGFHFFKGAPKKNWLLFYPVEFLCAFFTNTLITINKEDYNRAKRNMKAKNISYVQGVGISPKAFQNLAVDKSAKRASIGVPQNSFLLLSVGELNDNKNHSLVLEALRTIGNPNLHYIIVGQGANHDALLEKAKEYGLENNIHLLGYRTDVGELYNVADAFVFPSFREGLSVSLMEAMTSGLPCIVSEIRGNTDLIDENGGILFNPSSVGECANAIKSLLGSDIAAMGTYNTEKIKPFFIDRVSAEMKKIYMSMQND